MLPFSIIHFFQISIFAKCCQISKISKIDDFHRFLPPASPYISQSSIEYHVQTPGQIFPESSNGIFNIDPNPSQHYFQISLNFRPNLSKAPLARRRRRQKNFQPHLTPISPRTQGLNIPVRSKSLTLIYTIIVNSSA